MTANAPAPLRIGTRGSPLALAQAHETRARLAAAHLDLTAPEATEIVVINTTGDMLLDRTLADAGGKGLFTKEIEEALLDGRIDLAVHSMKDVPTALPPGLEIAALLPREDPRDAFLSRDGVTLDALPLGAVLGTAGLRRQAQILERRPDLKIIPLRGNVQTRLRKLDEGRYDAILLAAAGLKRLGLGERITGLIDPEESLPAVGQGALGIECRAERADLVKLMAPLNHADTALCVRAERAMSRSLAGSCQVPLGGFAETCGGQIRLRGFVSTTDGRRMARAETSGSPEDPEAVGNALAEILKAQGAHAILAELEAANR